MANLASESVTAKLSRELEAVREQQQAISAVLRALARPAGLQPVLDTVVESCRRLCHADHGAMWLLQGELLASVAHDAGGEVATYDRQHPHAVDRTTAAGRTALTRKPVHIPDIQKDAEYAYPGPRPERSMLGVPMIFEEDLIGVVVVVRIEPEPFSDEEIALVQTFADQAAVAITNARLTEAVERQRTELARFLFEHHRNAVLHRIAETIGLADELLPGEHQLALAQRADEDLEQLGIDRRIESKQ